MLLSICPTASNARVKMTVKLDRLRELRGWSLRRIAESAGVAYSTFREAVRVGSDFGVADAIRISRAMGVPVEWLFDDTAEWNALQQPPYWLQPGHWEQWRELGPPLLEITESEAGRLAESVRPATARKKRPKGGGR